MRNIIIQCFYSPGFGIGLILIVSGFLFWDRPFDPPKSEQNIQWFSFNEIEFTTGFRSPAYGIRVVDENDTELVLLSTALNLERKKQLVEFVASHNAGRVGWFNKCLNWTFSLRKNKCKVLLVLDSKNERLFHFSDSVKVIGDLEKDLIHRIFYKLPYIIGVFWILLTIFLLVFFRIKK